MLKLHASIFLISFAPVLAKLASEAPVFSISFSLRYGSLILLFLIHAFIWQRILLHIDLGVAYSAKSLSLVWGMLWAVIIFQETLSYSNIVGASLVIMGVVLIGRE
jgi:drug/metabolite transporter (DMT)-like permease